MLDDLNTELENADSKLDSTIKKVARVLHMNNGEHYTISILFYFRDNMHIQANSFLY